MVDFLAEVTQMANTASDDVVGLVLRLNSDDRKTKTLYSEPAGSQPNPINPGPEKRAAICFQQTGSNSATGPGTTAIAHLATGSLPQKVGLHAEELLILIWDSMLKEFELTEDKLKRVEIVLSKSPCFGGKGSAPMTVGGPDGTSVRYAEGCSSKLRQFCGHDSRKKIKFEIYFIALAGAHAGERDGGDHPYGPAAIRAPAWPAGPATPEPIANRPPTQINKALMTAEERALDPARIALAHAAESKNAASEARTLREKTFQDLKQQLQTAEKTKKKEISKQLGEAQKAVKAAQKTERSKTDELADKARDARHTSLSLAQQGIVQLSGLANVDVSRWRFL